MRAKNWHTWGGIPINRILKKLSEIICKISNLTAPFFLSTSVRSRDSYPPSWPLSSPYPYPDRWRGLLSTTWPSPSLYPNLVRPCDSCTSLDIPHLPVRIRSGHVTSLHHLYLPPLPIRSGRMTPVHNRNPGTTTKRSITQRLCHLT